VRIGRSLTVFILLVYTDDGVFMLLDAQVEMTARVAYIYDSNRTNYIEIHTQVSLRDFPTCENWL